INPPPQFEKSYCDILIDIRAAVRNAINDGLANSTIRLFLLDQKDIWFFEQGSGACLWKPNSCETCKPAYKPQKSDNDYELFLPVFKAQNLTRQQFIDLDPYSADTLQGDWYFKPPLALDSAGI